MSTRLTLVVAILCCSSASLFGQYAQWGPPCSNAITIEKEFGRVNAIARCAYTLGGVQDNRVTVSASHTLMPGNQSGRCTGAGYCGSSLRVSPYTASTTYTTSATFEASQVFLVFDTITVTDTKRTADPIRPRTANECELRPWLCDPNYFNCPLLVNTGQGPWHLTSSADGVEFDLDAEGIRDRTGWTAAGSTLAFVALDLNRNGRIDDGSELFGEGMLLPDGNRAPNGFTALAVHDANHDGRVDSADPIWTRLLLWRDTNHDGLSQQAELSRIDGSSVLALETAYAALHRRDSYGNELRLRSTAHMQRTGPEPYFDIFFTVQR
jgi:hypothetical protein